MELKFLLFTFLILFAVFGCIESGRGSSSRGSSSRGSSSRGSSSRGSSSHGSWGSSSHSSPTSHRGTSSSSFSWGTPSHNSGSSGSHGTSSHNTGSFLNSERNHGSSSSGTSHNNSPLRPFGAVPAPPKHTGSNNNSPFKPFGTVPPPKQIGNNNNSPFKPFGTVPPPKQIGNNNNSPFKPFGNVPPPKNHGIPSTGGITHTNYPTQGSGNSGTNYPRQPPYNPAYPTHGSTHPGGLAPPAPGFNVGPNGHGVTQTHVPTQGSAGGSVTYPRQPPYNPAYPTHGSTHPGGIAPPAPGFNVGPNGHGVTQTHVPTQGSAGGSVTYPRQPPYNPAYPTHGNTHPGGIAPPAPGFNLGPNNHGVTQTHHPTQGSANYPRQPPYNPAYPHIAPPIHSAYPGAQTHGQPIQNPQFYPQMTHSLPPNPAPTFVIVPGHSGGGGYQSRTTGDIFKEALIHAGVNAAVHRLTSPSHYYDRHSSSWNNYGTPSQGSSSSVTSTNTHTVINNYYGETQGGSGNSGSGTNLPNNNNNINGQTYPSGGIQGGVSNGLNNQGNNGNIGNPGFRGTTVSQIPSNGQSSTGQSNANGQGNNNVDGVVWDQELLNITEKLFSLDENNATKFISLNLQKQVVANNTNITDESPQNLLTVQPEAYRIPTIKAIRSLYEAAFKSENKTRLMNTRKEESLFVDLVLNTNVMIAAMDFLAQKNIVTKDYYDHKDMLKDLWFAPYDGVSSGFKRIFQGEVWEGFLWGIQDWIAFEYHEKAGRANYLSYMQKIDLGNTTQSPAILKTNFEMSGTKKTGTALFVGTSPELQMALYTICFYTRPNNYCDISLGGTKFKIYTHMDRYFGKDLINVAFPVV